MGVHGCSLGVHGCSCDIFVVLFKSIFFKAAQPFFVRAIQPKKKILFGSRLSQKSICKIIGYPANRF